jgi:DNA mismatch repair protein MutS
MTALYFQNNNTEAGAGAFGDDRRSLAQPHASPKLSDRRQEGQSGIEAVAAPLPSILFANPDDSIDDAIEMPAFFPDLNCDQFVDAVTAGREEYNLKPFFYGCLSRIDAILYRQEVMRDLENPSLVSECKTFARAMHDMREHVTRSRKLYYKEHKQAWFLDAVELYCNGLTKLAEQLSRISLRSRGFARFREYLARYVNSGPFTALSQEATGLKAALAEVSYSVLIRSNGFTVSNYRAESDLSATVEATFEKFKHGASTDYRVKFAAGHDMNHIEAQILEFVAKLYPDVFARLDVFCATHRDLCDAVIATFDREVQFYFAYLDYIDALTGAGLLFCYPRISGKDKGVFSQDGFDIVLAHKLTSEKRPVVCNSFELRGPERILVVSGPNQGGKTTFARTFGQLHYLANIGCPVPGGSAHLFHFDNLFTHFEREEKVETLRGKLEDDLVRIRHILAGATPRSVIVLNEIFTSTTLQDEIFLSRKVMEKIICLDLLCVWVTFVDELASFGPQAVSMVSMVVPENPAIRTFKILRRPADGLAYAMAIAQKYGLTYEAVKRRVRS